jgi:hypothetical protein
MQPWQAEKVSPDALEPQSHDPTSKATVIKGVVFT